MTQMKAMDVINEYGVTIEDLVEMTNITVILMKK